MIQAAGAQPPYEQVKAFVLQQIAEGAWAVDARIPSENALAARLGVSRMTARRALSDLAQTGLIVRVQGVGSFIANATPEIDLMAPRTACTEIAARGRTHAARVLVHHAIPARREHARLFDTATLTQLFRSLVLHTEAGAPYELEERLVRPDLVADYLSVDLNTQPSALAVLNATPVHFIDQEISVKRADDTLRKQLSLKASALCLVLQRWMHGEDGVVSVSRHTFAADQHRFRARIDLCKEGQAAASLPMAKRAQ